MGLLESLLNVPQELRVWQMSGVRYFLLPEPDSAVAEACASAQPETWPDPWPGFLAKCPAQPVVVLTYQELGHDLMGRSDKRRGGLWRRLIQDLGWAGQNKIAFWPVCIPEQDRLQSRPDIFLEAVKRLSPAFIAIFGQNAADRLSLDQAGDTLSLAGIACGILPDPGVLLTGDKEVWDHVLAQLSRY